MYLAQELEKQKSDYKKLFHETSALNQENVSLREQLKEEIPFFHYNKQCNDDENENLILLQQKGKH